MTFLSSKAENKLGVGWMDRVCLMFTLSNNVILMTENKNGL